MAGKDSPQSVIDSYRKRQQMMPFIAGGLAVLLVAVGIVILVVWFTGPNRPAIALFASATPTVTNTATFTPTVPTSTPTETPVPTETATITNTVTPAGPFEYTVQENDNCWDIAANFEVDLLVMLALNNFGNECPITPGDKILIPAPNQQLPTETAIPTDIARGTKLEIRVKPGETLDIIAARYNSTIEEILRLTNEYNKKNNLDEITDKNTIFAGQLVIVPVNIVTATPTRAATVTPSGATAAPSATNTTAP